MVETKQDIRDIIHNRVLESIEFPTSGLLKLAPRVGKTKLALRIIDKEKPESILWVTPNEKLRDEDIPNEFNKWGYSDYLDKTTIVCWASLGKIGGVYDKIILDEYQMITKGNSEGLFDGSIQFNSIIGLSGTHPKHKEKKELLKNLGLEVIYDIDIDEAVDLGIIADYRINIVEVPLDTRNNLPVKTKTTQFYTSEQKNYDYYTRQIEKDNIPNCIEVTEGHRNINILGKDYHLRSKPSKYDADGYWIITRTGSVFGYLSLKNGEYYGKFDYNGETYKIINKDLVADVSKMLYIKRMQVIHNLNSKYLAAKHMINKLEGKKLVFCSTINQAEKLSKHTFHSKTNKDDLDRFNNDEIDLLACVNSGGVGFTFENLDHLIIVQADSDKAGNTSQRFARSLLLQGNYKAKIWVLCSKNTVDEKWVESAFGNRDNSKINYLNIKDV